MSKLMASGSWSNWRNAIDSREGRQTGEAEETLHLFFLLLPVSSGDCFVGWVFQANHRQTHDLHEAYQRRNYRDLPTTNRHFPRWASHHPLPVGWWHAFRPQARPGSQIEHPRMPRQPRRPGSEAFCHPSTRQTIHRFCFLKPPFTHFNFTKKIDTL